MATSNDKAWKTFLDAKSLYLDGRSFIVDANELKEIAQREPRLLAKYDSPNELPKVFRVSEYALLAIENGKYLLFKGNIFHPVSSCDEREQFTSRLEFPLLTVGRGTGESEYLDNAVNTGMLSAFTNAGNLYLTIRGRERSKAFSFFIGQTEVQVDGVQIEVDGGYEGERDIVLVEAKIGADKHFNVRQLYYPYRHFSAMRTGKSVRNIYFQYNVQTATYTMFEYQFEESHRFDSIRLARCKAYSIAPQRKRTIDELMDTQLEWTTDTVPQADDLNKVLELLTLVNQGLDTPRDAADYFVYDIRQSSYYREAAEYLGLLSSRGGHHELTERGSKLLGRPPSEQQLFAAKIVVNSWIFRALIRIANRKGFFAAEDIERVIAKTKKTDGTQRYSQSTIPRRRQTIISWCNWLADEIGCFQRDGNRYSLQ